MADLVTIATTAALTQFVGPMFKHLGEQALERAKQVASTAAAQLKAVGREPQPVEPKLLVPLVQAAGLETDEALATHWAALLANAADPARNLIVAPAHIEILRQLSPDEARLLHELFVEIDTAVQPMVAGEPVPRKEILRKQYTIQHLLSLDSFYYKTVPENAGTIAEIEVRNRFDALVDNLLRQRTIILAAARPKKESPIVFNHKPDRSKALLTSLGYDFMLAVTPPAP